MTAPARESGRDAPAPPRTRALEEVFERLRHALEHGLPTHEIHEEIDALWEDLRDEAPRHAAPVIAHGSRGRTRRLRR